MTDEEVPEVVVPLLEMTQPFGTFYAGTMRAADLAFMAKSDVLRLKNLEVPKYEGYQRALDEERVDTIRKFLATSHGVFPGSIIVNVNSENVVGWEDATVAVPESHGGQTAAAAPPATIPPPPTTDAQAGDVPATTINPAGAAQPNGQAKVDNLSIIRMKRLEETLAVIDGQHRAAALAESNVDLWVPVTFFIDLEMVKCAEIFRVVNANQKKINPSISYQLFGYSDHPSPQKTAHNVARTLNETEGSPFYRRLKMIGKKDEFSQGALSQATFARELIALYSRKPVSDEYDLLLGRKLSDDAKLPLRPLFMAGDEKGIATTVWYFFAGVASQWETSWKSPESILWRTTGYVALMRVLKEWLLSAHAGELSEFQAVRQRFAHAGETIGEDFFAAENFAGSGYKEASTLAKSILDALFDKV